MSNSNTGSLLRQFGSGFVSIFIGMGSTLKNLVMRPKITVSYPFEKLAVSARYRGLFYLKFNEDAGRLNCVGCTLCAQACPTKVITMTKVGSGKFASVSEFRMDLGRCMFCSLCVEACPFDAIYMGPQYELASFNRDVSVFELAALAQGGQEAVERTMRTIAEAAAAAPPKPEAPRVAVAKPAVPVVADAEEPATGKAGTE